MRLFSVLIYGVTTWCVITSRFVNGSIYLSSIKLEHIMADDCFQKRLFRGQKNFYLSKGTFRSVLNIYLITTLLMTILTFTWRKNKNNVQEIKEKYNVTAFTTN